MAKNSKLRSLYHVKDQLFIGTSCKFEEINLTNSNYISVGSCVVAAL